MSKNSDTEAWVRGAAVSKSPCGGCPSEDVRVELTQIFVTIDRLIEADEIGKPPSLSSIHRRIVDICGKAAPGETKLRKHIKRCLKR